MSLIEKTKAKAKTAYLMAGVSFSMISESAFATTSSAYNASGVNSEAKNVAEFFISLIQGYVGYAIAIAIFIYGVFKYFQDQKLWALFTSFGVALAIVFVPGMLESFFNTSTS